MRKTPSGREVNQAELTSIFGITAPTVRAWEGMGCPIVMKGGRGKSSTYNTADVFKWREQTLTFGAAGDSTSVDYEEGKRRKMVAEAILAEVEADLRVGNVVLIDDVVTATVGEYNIIRNKILSLGSRIAPRLAIIKDPVEVKDLIDREVGVILTELTQYAEFARARAASCQADASEIQPAKT